MLPVAQRVDDRDLGVPRQLFEQLLLESAADDRVAEAIQHAGDIFGRLALAQPDLGRREVERVAAQPAHRQLERDARAQRRLLENQKGRLARPGARVRALRRRLLRLRRVEHRRNLGRAEIRYRQERPRHSRTRFLTPTTAFAHTLPQ